MRTVIKIIVIAVAFFILVLVVTEIKQGKIGFAPLIISISLIVAFFVTGARAIWKYNPDDTDKKKNDNANARQQEQVKTDTYNKPKKKFGLLIVLSIILIIGVIFIVGLADENSQDTVQETPVKDTIRGPIVHVSAGKILYDSIPLFMGMSKLYFFQKFGNPRRQIWGKKIDEKDTEWKNPFDEFIYDSLGITIQAIPNSDTIAFIYFFLGKNGGGRLPTNSFKGSILFDTFQVSHDFNLEKFKTAEGLEYYYYGDYSIWGTTFNLTHINKNSFQGKIYDASFTLTLEEASSYTSVNPTSVSLYFSKDFYPRNKLGWQKEDLEELTSFFYTNLKLDKELKALGYSEKRKSRVWDCLADKISRELMFGKYLDMNDTVRMDLYQKYFTDCTN